MRGIIICLLSLGAVSSSLACNRRDSNSSPRADKSGNQAADSSNLAARFDAAAGMNNIALKDESLIKLAEDAAKGGNGEIAKKAVDSIQNIGLHDDAAYNSALSLAKSGKAGDAVAIAESINNLAKRDEALASIAKGE